MRSVTTAGAGSDTRAETLIARATSPRPAGIQVRSVVFRELRARTSCRKACVAWPGSLSACALSEASAPSEASGGRFTSLLPASSPCVMPCDVRLYTRPATAAPMSVPASPDLVST